jgi:hypothetical protein
MAQAEEARKFSILLHEGNVPGLTKEVINGTALEARQRARRLQEGLSKEQRDAGWRYEWIKDPSAPARPAHKGRGGEGRGGRDNSRR